MTAELRLHGHSADRIEYFATPAGGRTARQHFLQTAGQEPREHFLDNSGLDRFYVEELGRDYFTRNQIDLEHLQQLSASNQN